MLTWIIFFASVLQYITTALVLISYDIACQWFINLFKCMEEWPTKLHIPQTTKLIPVIPKLYEPIHNTVNHQVYSLNFIPGVGQSDLECPE
jgi:hypothetical protein